ncbi:disease resistance protein RPP13-like isoform X3 [Salvia miltiorrhiza]|uniref:disease resistance protein RPP13-like isoform X3 n=1 Tax=Salvia miltiorrhiza TaxID=226208 RepID=UPI0025AC642F|nr:disease resistance protein RPP13-like isoform X3 [Salvia miltiorrhiza]
MKKKVRNYYARRCLVKMVALFNLTSQNCQNFGNFGKIAKNCEGLPLMIVTVADILSKAQNADPKYWDDVAEMRNSVFTDAYNEISKVLFPSYDYLPQYLKMPFLYMGVFPPDYDIPLSKIMNMLATEDWFHNTKKKRSLEDSVWQCLDELCKNKNLVLFNQRSISRTTWMIVNRKFKTCRLHSSWRHVCRGEARKNKFYHVLKKLVEGLEDDVKVLKLRAYAFRGPKWEAREGSFMKVKFLLVKDSDLVQWKPKFGSFPDLVCLSMKHCYKLEEIHWPSKISFGVIELRNCNPVALTCAKQLQLGRYASVDVTATSSFDEKPIAIKFTRHGFERLRQGEAPYSPFPLSVFVFVLDCHLTYQ